VSDEPSLPFIARYQASGFPPGIIKRIDDINFTESELVHALFTTGRAPGDQLAYGDSSLWELLHRISLLRAYIRQDYAQHLRLSRLARDLDRSERSALSYAIGQAMTCIFSRKVLSIQYLMHVERYSSRWSLQFSSRKRPDLFGRGTPGWVVAEAKCRASVPDSSLIEKIQAQKTSVASIQSRPPDLTIGCISYFSPHIPWLQLSVVDPESQHIETMALQIDTDRFFLTYYEPFVMAVDLGGSEERELTDSQNISARFDPFELRIGLLRSIYELVRRAKEVGDLTGLSQSVLDALADSATTGNSLFSDGTLIETDWRESIAVNDWEH
jgi:hypothetical protein